ncbi:hypothetical protein BBD39_06175 [Arsenophonus endosymbiont of Bemisia tabaci Asia II 3]|nr:hypothetical protein BBD39_06175 [Arsenophonus endosymbiont of Bemisia tabaci Asia II 3]
MCRSIGTRFPRPVGLERVFDRDDRVLIASKGHSGLPRQGLHPIADRPIVDLRTGDLWLRQPAFSAQVRLDAILE